MLHWSIQLPPVNAISAVVLSLCSGKVELNAVSAYASSSLVCIPISPCLSTIFSIISKCARVHTVSDSMEVIIHPALIYHNGGSSREMSAQISWNLRSLDLGPEWLRRTEPLTYVTLQRQGTLEPTEIRTPWRTVVARQIRALATKRSFFSCKFVQKPITLGLPCRSWKNELHSMILHCDLQSICIPSTVIH